jgi:peptidoglycan/LPS O-acetylase OafA/YrhL
MVKRLFQLDGLRGIAALMVIFYHYFIDLEIKNSTIEIIKKISTIGQTGVTLFFVLSGFLITRILINEKNSKSYFKSFYLRRTLRIFPLYYFFLVLFYFLLPFFSKTTLNPENSNIFYYFIFLQNFALTFNWDSYGPVHYWSLAVEEHFYLLFPFFVYYSKLSNLKLICYSFIFISVVSRILLVYNNYEVYFFSFSAFDAIVLGALVSIIEHENKLELYFNSLKKIILYFLLPSAVLWIMFSGKKNEFIQVIKLSLTPFFIRI